MFSSDFPFGFQRFHSGISKQLNHDLVDLVLATTYTMISLSLLEMQIVGKLSPNSQIGIKKLIFWGENSDVAWKTESRN